MNRTGSIGSYVGPAVIRTRMAAVYRMRRARSWFHVRRWRSRKEEQHERRDLPEDEVRDAVGKEDQPVIQPQEVRPVADAHEVHALVVPRAQPRRPEPAEPRRGTSRAADAPPHAAAPPQQAGRHDGEAPGGPPPDAR